MASLFPLLLSQVYQRNNSRNHCCLLQGDDFLGAEDIFTHSGEKKVELKPPVRKALAMFSGKRNPNDNHFSRKKN
uniref:Uncharacterized protein n=1 Tax=Aegilops tauschii subsp. strangulata TaxID=200361 RepID=A0A453MUR6_AEGTS